MRKKKVNCPFCEGDGCCFCDHEGKVYVGPDEFIKSEDLLNSIGVKYLKEKNPEEIWPEMWDFFLDENNVPAYFKKKHGVALKEMTVVDIITPLEKDLENIWTLVVAIKSEDGSITKKKVRSPIKEALERYSIGYSWKQ